MPTDMILTRRRILRVVLTYALVAALWIALSDQAVEWLFSSPMQQVLASTLKGWAFICITALLLYTMLLRFEHQPELIKRDTLDWRRQLFVFSCMAFAIIGITGLGIDHTVQQEQSKEVARIQAIADIKSRQISDWLEERHRDAELLKTSQVYAGLYQRWRTQGDLQSRDQLLASLEVLRKIRGYRAVSLFDERGQRIWGSAPASLDQAPGLLAAIRQAQTTHQVQRVGPYLNSDQNASLDFLAALPERGSLAPVVVLRTESSDWLNATLSAWPVASSSGETLLFRREGQRVVYLSKLRHAAGAPLKLSLSLASKDLLAAKLLRHEVHQGDVITGYDYRHTAVMGVGRVIPHTDWYLIAKKDQSEVYAVAFRNGIWIGLAGMLILFVAAAGFVLLRQREQLQQAEQERQAQGLHLQSMQLLAAVANSSEDPIFAKDLEGRYLLFNRAACQLLGKSSDEVLGRDDFALFPAEQAQVLQAFGQQVISQDVVLTEKEYLTIQNQPRVFLSTKGPLKTKDGECIGIFGISRDITEQSASERAIAQQTEELRQRNTELERINRAMVGRELDMLELKRQINTLSEQLGLAPPYAQAAQLTQELDQLSHRDAP